MKGQKKNTETAMHMNSFLPWKVDERVAKLVKTTCFKNFLELGDGHHKPNHKLNLSLLTVVMSFFDTKKMAFSFRKNCIVDFGLEDILYITGLPIDGEQVSGEESSDNVGIIKTYLKISEEKAKGLSKRTLGISPALLKSQFENVPENLEGEDLEPYFMAYLLFLLGTLVVPNKTKDISPMYLPLLQKDKVNNYAWGAAMLAILKDSLFEWKESYTNDGTTTSLCGFALALQVFALERFPISQQQSPSKFPLMVEWEKVYKPYTKGCSVETVEQYEKMFLNMKKDEIKWQPYSKIELPKEYTSQLRMVFANVPCICFNIISYNYPGTFFTQLGLEKSDLTGEKLWGKKIKGTPKQRSKHKDKNWRVCTKFYEEVNRRWESRYDHLVYQRHIEETKVNGENLAEIAGGEVAITNLNSRGEEFWFQIRFSLTSEKREGRPQEANARLKFVYFPIVQGKESIEKILENLEEEGCKVSESFETFGRVSIRRLGRLLPEVRWDSIPFMKQGNRASTLQKSCQRVKCFVDLDAGFNPTPSKTDLASQNPFSVALRNFGSKSTEKEKDTDVKIMIHREEKQLNNKQLEQTYRDWVTKMHNTHDEEATSGQDEPTLVVELDKKALNISHDAVRVHKVIMRKGKSWKRGQNIKILKGACAGVHNGNVYATIDYFLIEGFEDEPGGDTRILCRPINLPKNKGCMLSIIDGTPSLEVKSSLSLPIAIIDSGKCLHVGADEWNTQLEKQQEKAPSEIDLLDERACNELKIDGELPVGDPVRAGRAPPQQIVAVVRPACFTSSTPQKKLDQKHIVKDGEEMVMVVKRLDTNMKSSDKKWSWSCSQRVFPTSRDGISGLYIFSLGSKFSNLFEKAGTYNFSFSVGDSIRCKKEVVVRPSKAASWKLEDNLEPAVRVGSSLPPFCVACFDEYDNRVPFASVPSLDVKLEANPGFQLEFDKIEAKLIEGRSILKIENMVVETDELDKIRPNYEATLEIRAKDKPFAVSVACKVIPGPVERVAMNNPHALDNLLPGSTVDTLILEIFDEYNNHVAEGTDVLLHIDGYRIQDWMGVIRKVDASGCIDLSGILKVTEGYGKSVSFSVMSGIEEIFKKESQIQERELRLITELPVSCAAGSNIQNLIFNVTDSDGSVDATIHHDEKSGCFHTMSIESGSGNIQSGIRYAFIHGSCRVPTLSVPENESVFSFRVFHSRFPELHVNLEIPLMPALTFERDEIGCSTPYSKTTTTPQSKMASTTNPGLSPTPSVGLGLTPCSQFGVLAIRSSSLDNSSQTGLIDMTQFTESLKQKVDIYGAQKMKIDERLKCLEAEQGQAEQELSTLQASLGPISAAFPECLSTRESMMRQIEEKQHDTAAAVFCCLYRKAAPPQSMFLSNKGVFGIVALLGSVASTSLSRVLSEYLGKDTMLALVCKSSQCGPKSVEYMRLQSEAALLNRSITSRFLIICLDATRPWSSGLVKNDPQRKLAMDNPCLPNGDPIPGFIGYAVNMIELDLADLDIQANSGHGLRETLFYGVFGDLQVYETGEYLQAALPHINEDAVSLDGVIFKENGFIYSGCCKPEIHFPITVTEKQEKTLVKLELTRDRKRKAEKMMAEENCSLRKLEKKLKKATQKYQNFTAAMADS